MRSRLFRDIALTVLVILGLLVPAVAAAQEPPFGAWQPIGAGESQRFAIRYYYDNTQPEDTEPLPMTVILSAVDESRSVDCVVNTAATLKLPQSQKDADKDKDSGPLGFCAPMFTGRIHEEGNTEKQLDALRLLGDEHGIFKDWYHLVWETSTKENVVFFVDVRNIGESTKFYKLEVKGPAVLLK